MKTYLKKQGRNPVVHWNENAKHSYEELSEMVNMILNGEAKEYPNVEDTKDNESSKDICLKWIKHAQ